MIHFSRVFELNMRSSRKSFLKSNEEACADSEPYANTNAELLSKEEQTEGFEVDPLDEIGENDDGVHPEEVQLMIMTENIHMPSDRSRCENSKYISGSLSSNILSIFPECSRKR